ncbi:MAG TPA: polysaccharide deacetylase family protein [Bacteroidia bacterium]|jgi:peptidoglycan/xylan/chitin deacetylase (PgdA/CDA1 family)|nr:polysaccharide deacetylase family protein [Bacteroidia bacterium]
MFRSRIPAFAKIFLPQIICRPETGGKKIVYLTFDDGPIPETTPYVLTTLKKYGIKATFFCVGENVKKHPELYAHILEDGHFVGNHTFNHLKGWKTSLNAYLENVQECSKYIESGLFRPPYGKMTVQQYNALKNKFKLIFWDVLTPDYDLNVSAQQCLDIIKKKTRQGSILVFHDNLKAKNKLTELLPGALDFLIREGYEIQPVTNNISK